MAEYFKNQFSRKSVIPFMAAIILANLTIIIAMARAPAGGYVTPGLKGGPISPDGVPGRRRSSSNRSPAEPLNPVPILPALPDANDMSFYASNDIPHGRVEQVYYKTAGGKEKRMHVYLPPGYETDSEKRYPVLYLNHGGGENDSHWTAANPRSGGYP